MSDKFKLKYGFSNTLLYALLFAFMLFLNFVGNSFEPYSLCLYFAMLICGMNAYLSGGLFIFASGLCFFKNGYAFIVFFVDAIILTLIFFIYSRTKRKMGAEIIAYATVAILPFLIVFSKLVYGDFFKTLIISFVLFILIFIFISALKCILFKAGRARLFTEELLFISTAIVCVGIGFLNCVGEYAYDALAILLILSSCAIVKNSSAVFGALVLALPKIIVQSVVEGMPVFSAGAIFVAYCAVALCFLRAGKLPCALAIFFFETCVRFLSVFWNAGTDIFSSAQFYLTLLVSLVPCLLFLCVPDFLFNKLSSLLKLYSEKQLTRLNVNENRSASGEKLYEISTVFKEIENTFICLDDFNSNSDFANSFALEKLAGDVCSQCPSFNNCKAQGMDETLLKLITVGCSKGKVTLIDLPARLTAECVNPSAILFSLNCFLTEYRKSMLEAENISAGKRLLAEQAKGVSEVLKTLALEQSAPLVINTELEWKLRDLLTKKGVIVSEISVYGDTPTLTMTISGNHDLKKILDCAEQVTGVKITLSKKIPLAREKYYYCLKPKPRLDAAFGVATQKKDGENASGDTHSVIKIDERTFMLALSDGMGSGEYAKKISECTISLIESFFRAKMPTDTVLSTINQLLAFNKRESFSCVDTVTVDLMTGECDLVKIGSPLSFILSENKLQVLESQSLPLGILETVKPTVFKETLDAGDTVVLVSDGITSAFSSSTDICTYLESAPCINPQTFADELLKKAIDLCGNADDMTVIAVRLFESAQ